MRKSLLAVSCVLTLVLLAAVPALALETQAPLSRGEFATLLVQAAELDGEGEAADILMQHQIMKGVPGKNADLDRPISRVEAAVLISRTLGIPDDVSPRCGAESSLAPDHWATGVYGWLERLAISAGDPLAVLGADEAATMVHSTFETSEQALTFLEEAQQAATNEPIKTLKARTGGAMRIIPRTGLDDEEGLVTSIIAQTETVQEMVLPDAIHQVTTTWLDLPGIGVQTMTMESYMAGGHMYQQLPNPETGEYQWYRYPENMISVDLEAVMEAAQQNTQPIPAGLEKSLFYKIIGTKEIDGQEVYEVAFYGKIDDFNALLETLSTTVGEGLLTEGIFEQTGEIIKSMAFWGVSYIDAQSYRTLQSDFGTYVAFTEEFEDESVPMEAIEMFMNTGDYVYDSVFEIEIPEEVLSAPELPFP